MADDALPDIRQVLAIHLVAVRRSFGIAADAMHTTQPTLSRLIAATESQLGALLFRRGWSGTETTSAGEAVARRCARIIAAIDDTEAELYPAAASRPSLRSALRRRLLETIDAVVRTGSLSAAAAELGRSQPDLTRTLSGFASHTGLGLFRRTRNGMEPLPAARILARLHGGIAHEIAGLPQLVARQQAMVAGRVSVGMLPFSGQSILMRVFAQLSNLYPAVHLVCVPGSYDSLVEALRRRQIDRIIGHLRGRQAPTDLIEETLYEEQFTVLARHDHPLQGRARTIADLRETNWMVGQRGTPVRAYFEALHARSGATPPMQTCEMLSFAAAEEMLTESNSVAMLSYSRRALDRLHPALRALDVELPDAGVTVGLTRIATGETEPALVEFEQLMRDAVKLENVALSAD